MDRTRCPRERSVELPCRPMETNRSELQTQLGDHRRCTPEPQAIACREIRTDRTRRTVRYPLKSHTYPFGPVPRKNLSNPIGPRRQTRRDRRRNPRTRGYRPCPGSRSNRKPRQRPLLRKEDRSPLGCPLLRRVAPEATLGRHRRLRSDHPTLGLQLRKTPAKLRRTQRRCL